MLYGLYLSSQGAQSRATQLDVVANNIANANTSGFKRDLALFREFKTFDRETGQASGTPGNVDQFTGGMGVAETVTDRSQGALSRTGGNLDLALSGSGYFRVSDGSAEYLTRDGHFAQNAVGELVSTEGGERLLSTNGTPIVVARNATDVTIGPDGLVSQLMPTGEQIPIGQIDVVEPVDENAVQKVGRNRYLALGQTQPAPLSTRVQQGYIEASGVNPVLETMQMISASRGFETNVNMMRAQDESLGRLLSAARP